MPQRIDVEKMRMNSAAELALSRAVRELPLRTSLRGDNHRPAIVGNNGFWDDGEPPEFIAYWVAGDIVGSAPN
jgi:hypothetical protein